MEKSIRFFRENNSYRLKIWIFYFLHKVSKINRNIRSRGIVRRSICFRLDFFDKMTCQLLFLFFVELPGHNAKYSPLTESRKRQSDVFDGTISRKWRGFLLFKNVLSTPPPPSPSAPSMHISVNWTARVTFSYLSTRVFKNVWRNRTPIDISIRTFSKTGFKRGKKFRREGIKSV